MQLLILWYLVRETILLRRALRPPRWKRRRLSWPLRLMLGSAACWLAVMLVHSVLLSARAHLPPPGTGESVEINLPPLPSHLRELGVRDEPDPALLSPHEYGAAFLALQKAGRQ